jgi:hypothetical protein
LDVDAGIIYPVLAQSFVRFLRFSIDTEMLSRTFSASVVNGAPRVKIKTKIKERVTPHPLH